MIDLPEGERHRSRKSISIYLYTKDRPAEEVAPEHGTFYVQRPLPERFRAGYTLTDADAKDLEELLIRRDKWIETYQKAELKTSREASENAAYIAELRSLARAPLTGYILQDGKPGGLHSDCWVAPEATLRVSPQRPVTGLCLRGWRPESRGAVEITVKVNGEVVTTAPARDLFEVNIPLSAPLDQPFTVELLNTPAFCPENDPRDICYILLELRAEYAAPEIPAAPAS